MEGGEQVLGLLHHCRPEAGGLGGPSMPAQAREALAHGSQLSHILQGMAALARPAQCTELITTKAILDNTVVGSGSGSGSGSGNGSGSGSDNVCDYILSIDPKVGLRIPHIPCGQQLLDALLHSLCHLLNKALQLGLFGARLGLCTNPGTSYAPAQPWQPFL